MKNKPNHPWIIQRRNAMKLAEARKLYYHRMEAKLHSEDYKDPVYHEMMLERARRWKQEHRKESV